MQGSPVPELPHDAHRLKRRNRTAPPLLPTQNGEARQGLGVSIRACATPQNRPVAELQQAAGKFAARSGDFMRIRTV
jgi:hypothetical protein